MRKTVIGMAVGMAFSPLAFGVQGVLWDLDGGTMVGNEHIIQEWAWNAGNALALGLFPAANTSGTFYAQAKIGGLTDSDGNGRSVPAGFTYTYQLVMPVASDQTGDVVTFTDGGGATFRMYYHSIAAMNEYTGTGFDAGTLVLSGSATIQNDSFDFTKSATPAKNVALVALGQTPATGSNPSGACGVGEPSTGDIGAPCTDARNLPSLRGGANFQINIDLSFAHSDFFKSNFTSFELDLTLETAGLGLPFGNATPVSGSVVGNTPYFGDPESGTFDHDNTSATAAIAFTSRPVNDFVCNNGDTANCDMQYQISGNSRPNASVPEPGSLALLGLSLGALGVAGLRRRRLAAK